MSCGSNPKLDKWNQAYQSADISSATATQVLSENTHLLPQTGEALDLACGRAGNALFLARKGFEVDAMDMSPIVLEKVQAFVAKQGLPINCIERDIETQGLPAKKKYDVIVVSYFLNRDLFQQIISALKPNGLLYYQTWSQLSTDDSKGPSNPAFHLEPGELLQLCSETRIIFYSENGLLGNLQKGLRNEALLICQKR